MSEFSGPGADSPADPLAFLHEAPGADPTSSVLGHRKKSTGEVSFLGVVLGLIGLIVIGGGGFWLVRTVGATKDAQMQRALEEQRYYQEMRTREKSGRGFDDDYEGATWGK